MCFHFHGCSLHIFLLLFDALDHLSMTCGLCGTKLCKLVMTVPSNECHDGSNHRQLDCLSINRFRLTFERKHTNDMFSIMKINLLLHAILEKWVTNTNDAVITWKHFPHKGSLMTRFGNFLLLTWTNFHLLQLHDAASSKYCTNPIMHLFCNRNMHTCARFCYKVGCGNIAL